MSDAWVAARDGADPEQVTDINIELALCRAGRPLKVFP